MSTASLARLPGAARGPAVPADVTVALIGLGPHARRIYLHYLALHGAFPALVVELESAAAQTEAALRAAQPAARPCQTLFVPDAERDAEELSPAVQERLLDALRTAGVTHVILATEPKAHYAYLRFLLTHDLNVLCDKPLTAPVHVSTQPRQAELIHAQYQHLKALYLGARARGGASCQVQCQRRWHDGYAYVHALLREVVHTYGVPITSIDLYHCDGMWNMPDELFFRENHPYKYGYGKLMHSGYHFVDVLGWLYGINGQLERKRADTVAVTAHAVRPSDHLTVLDDQDYARLLRGSFSPWFEPARRRELGAFGELDVNAHLQFTRQGRVVTTGTLHLLQTGFTRRSWGQLPSDTYKGNGRVRHERLNVQVGPLLNLQIHSYQAREIKERDASTQAGAVEHFEVYVFRNTDLIGGQPFERIDIQSLAHLRGPEALGFNEQAREQSIMSFLTGDTATSDLLDHDLSIGLLASIYGSLAHRYQGLNPERTLALHPPIGTPLRPPPAPHVRTAPHA